MVKGSYNCAPSVELGAVPQSLPQTKVDNSYKSMMCTLLVFLAICLIILLVAFPYKSMQKEQIKKSSNGYSEELSLNHSSLPENHPSTTPKDVPKETTPPAVLQEITRKTLIFEEPTEATGGDWELYIPEHITIKPTPEVRPKTTTRAPLENTSKRTYVEAPVETSGGEFDYDEEEKTKETTTKRSFGNKGIKGKIKTLKYVKYPKSTEYGTTTTEAGAEIGTTRAGETTTEVGLEIGGASEIEVENEETTTGVGGTSTAVVAVDIRRSGDEGTTTEVLAGIGETSTEDGTTKGAEERGREVGVGIEERTTEVGNGAEETTPVVRPEDGRTMEVEEGTVERTTEVEGTGETTTGEVTAESSSSRTEMGAEGGPTTTEVMEENGPTTTEAMARSRSTRSEEMAVDEPTTTEKMAEDGPRRTEDTTETLNEKGPTASEEITEDDETTDHPTHKEGTSRDAFPSLFKEQKPVCQDQECKFISTSILSKINHAVDPCEDFYDYACGNYGTDKDKANTFKRLLKEIQKPNQNNPGRNFQKLYEKCVKFHEKFNYEDRVSKAKEIFYNVSKIYGAEEKIQYQMNTTELIMKLLFLDFSPVFDVDVDVDKRTKRFVFQIKPGKLDFHQSHSCFNKALQKYTSKNVNLNRLYSDYSKCQSNLSDYLDTMDRSLRTFGAFPEVDQTEKDARLRSIRNDVEFDILTTLKKIPREEYVKKSLKKKYKVEKLSTLEEKYPFIQWCKLFSKLRGSYIDNKQNIQIYFEEYFEELFQQLNDMPHWKLHNALMAMFAQHVYQKFVEPKNVDVSRHCLEEASTLLRREATATYLGSFTDSEISSAGKEIRYIFDSLKSNLSSMVDNAEWLDTKSSEVLRKKIEEIQIVSEDMLDSFRNESFMNSHSLDENLGNSTTDISEMDYQNQVVEIVKRNQKEKFGMWNGSSSNLDNTWWNNIPNFYSGPKSVYITGKILFPLYSLLKVPKNVPKYIKLASVDYLIAKEIGHQFDSIGTTYSPTGSGPVLTNDAMTKYHEMKTCQNDKYSIQLSQKREEQTYNFIIDADLSLDKRIAEDVALRLMDATSPNVINEPLLPFMSDSFSREKILYITLAQAHCQKTSPLDFLLGLFESPNLTPSLLVKSFLGNSERFPQIFDCKEGSGMHHPIKCQQFPDLDEPMGPTPEYAEYPISN